MPEPLRQFTPAQLQVATDALLKIVQLTQHDREAFEIWHEAASALSALGVDLSWG